MSEIDKKVMEFSKPASKVKHSRKIAWTVTRAEIEQLNANIETKIKQNRAERQASWKVGRKEIVK